MILTNKKQSRSLYFFLLLCFVTNIIIAGDTQNNSCADISTENKTVKQNSNKTDKDPEATDEKIKKTTKSEAENTTTHHPKRKRQQKPDASYTYLTSAASTLIITASTLITGGLAYLIYNLATSSNNLLSTENNSLLHATKKGDLKRVETLLQNGANPDIRNDYGETPLIIASRSGTPKLVEMLLKYKANVNMQNNYGRTALSETVGRRAAKCCFHTKAESKCRKKNALKKVKLLLKNGADPNITTHDLKTINTDRYLNVSPLTDSLSHQNHKIARALLEYGADPNKGYVHEGHALHIAIKNHKKHKWHQEHSEINYKCMIAQLIAHGADLNKQEKKIYWNQEGCTWSHKTPFHIAAKHYDAQTITAFISMGARMNIKNKYGVTPKTTLLKRFGYLKMLTFYKERFKYILSSRLGKKNPPTPKKDHLATRMIGIRPFKK